MFDLRKSVKNRLSFGDICRKLVLSWLTAVLAGYIRLPVEFRKLSEVECLENTSFSAVVITAAVIWVGLCLLGIFVKTEKFERNGIFLVFASVAVLSIFASAGLPFFIACTLLLGCFGAYAIGNVERLRSVLRHKKFPLGLTVSMTAAFFVFVSVWTVCRVRAFSAPTYDFGIFSQMFYNMKESGLPLTTLERDGVLSHFAVHVSPIYYLFLPVYYVFPFPETLQLLQAGVMSLSVIPLWKLCRYRGLSDWVSALICGILLFFPAFGGGAGYDLHENCFLTPLIFSVFYCLERKRFPWALFFSLLTLCVKEDAAVYVCVTGLWYCVRVLLSPEKTGRKRALAFGAAMILLSVGWFWAVTSYLSLKGDGVMTYRYGNFMYDGSESLITVVKAVIMNPMKAVYECVDSEKLKYIGLTMLPLLGIPLFTRKYERCILLIPYLLVNLMSDYRYQHDIFFQYGFGSTAFLIYLTVVNLADVKSVKKQIIVSAAALTVCAGCFFGSVVPSAVRYPTAVIEKREHYQRLRAFLEQIPKDASVAATTFYTVPLSSRSVIYDVGYCSEEHLLSSEFIVVNPTDKGSLKKYAPGDDEEVFGRFEKLLHENGYETLSSYGDCAVVFEKSE